VRRRPGRYSPIGCPASRIFFIRSHQARVAGHIGGEDSGEAANWGHFLPGGRCFNPTYFETCGGPSVEIAGGLNVAAAWSSEGIQPSPGAATHSITSSARARIAGESVRPSALAVFRLTANL
jgi:hypothetical protein